MTRSKSIKVNLQCIYYEQEGVHNRRRAFVDSGKGVPAGIYGWDEYGRGITKYNPETGKFEPVKRQIWRKLPEGQINSSEFSKADDERDPTRIKWSTDENGKKVPLGCLFTVNSPDETNDLPIVYVARIPIEVVAHATMPNVSYVVCEIGDPYPYGRIRVSAHALSLLNCVSYN
jgi:hypothetical protein